MKFQRLPRLVGQGYKLIEYNNVACVRPSISKGITDLLLPNTHNVACVRPSICVVLLDIV